MPRPKSLKKKITVGTKIIPNMGDYRGRTLIVTDASRVSQSSERLGTKTGDMIYFAKPFNFVGGVVWYRRGDFRVA